ncbi:TPA: hypothetical protein IQC28_002501 [Listeria monocytogenes]|nr:hypothetical protein [Listeria monocytogenes]HAO5741461.1 hypothetical protein [Listeria monocytogenes]HAO5770105.1 hypothetical protein [Listeria monocytogenes]HAO5778394.1 hypothetical protein [Listeria monocytogenes]HAO5983739.1 hypothetical protein [Listeria monocytogenes]
MTQLLILGNGFDVQAGLKCKYSDFFKNRMEQFGLLTVDGERIDKEALDFLSLSVDPQVGPVLFNSISLGEEKIFKQSSEVNFWELEMAFSESYYEEINWYNVEEHINKVVRNLNNHFREMSSPSNLSNFEAKNNFKTPGPISLAPKSIKKYQEEMTQQCGGPISNYMIYLAILGKIYDEKSYFKTDVLTIMSQEIRKYETKFDAYLRECAKSPDYQRIAKENLSKLIQEDNNQDVSANVLSFNYTHIPSKVISEEGDEISIKVKDNVHGKLGNEIIFGIDHGTIDNDTPLYNFTKTYRKLYENKDSEESVLSLDIKVIKIYGHSLSNADYAYFQSIFDFLNIYENPINIIVYYTKYKESEAEIRQELSNAVQKLISRYGQSMDNKEKGKNLLHKLLLENRLTIKKINLKEASK